MWATTPKLSEKNENLSCSDRGENQSTPDDLEAGTSRADESKQIGEHGVDLCAICLNEYCDGDEISWSQNKDCTHIFHRECVMQWLLTHKECPCCRHVYLQSDDDERNGIATPHNELYERTLQRGLELLSNMATQGTNSQVSPTISNGAATINDTTREGGNATAEDIEAGLEP
jgi:Ring finger domain